MKNLGFIYSPLFLEHNPGAYHPECSERLQSIIDKLKTENIWNSLTHYSPESAIKDDILLAHHKDLVEYNLSQYGKENFQLDPDTILSEESIPAAMTAAGAGILATKLVLNEAKHKRVFVACRPPGHHAEFNRTMGFCIFNNIAIAAAYAIKKGFVKNALIIDWDVHHGNGTQEIFYKRSDVFYLSLHQSPLYPGTGATSEKGFDVGEGFTLNCPLPAKTNDEKFINTLEQALLKVEEKFSPDILFISAGFDSHFSDQIGRASCRERV